MTVPHKISPRTLMQPKYSTEKVMVESQSTSHVSSVVTRMLSNSITLRCFRWHPTLQVCIFHFSSKKGELQPPNQVGIHEVPNCYRSKFLNNLLYLPSICILLHIQVCIIVIFWFNIVSSKHRSNCIVQTVMHILIIIM